MKILVVFLITIIGLLGFYVFQVTAEVSERFLVEECEKKLSDLSGENKILEISSAQKNSLGKTEEIITNLGFEKIDKIHYLTVRGIQVVVSD